MSSRRLMLSAFLFCCSVPAVMAAELHMYAGAGLRPPIEKVISQFEKETGNTVTVEYGGSGQILTRFELTKQGDLFFPGRRIMWKSCRKKNRWRTVIRSSGIFR